MFEDALKGRYNLYDTGMKIVNSELDTVSEEKLHTVREGYREAIRDIKLESNRLQDDEKRRIVISLSKTRFACFYIKQNEVNFYILDTKQNIATRYISIDEMMDINERLYSVVSQGLYIIKNEDITKTINPNIGEKVKSVENYIDDPTRAGPQKTTLQIDKDFSR